VKLRILFPGLIAVLTAMYVNEESNAQGAFTGAAVETIVADLSTEIQNIIVQLEYSADVTSFKIRSDLLLLLEHLEFTADKLSGKVFDDLTEIERKFFNDIRQTLALTDEIIRSNIGHAEELLSSLGGEFSRLPFVDETPLVNRFIPAVYVDDGSRILVEAQGSRLAAETPEMELEGRECRISAKTELSVSFDCNVPRDGFSKDTPFLRAKASFFEEKSWWQIFGGASREYIHEIRVLPPIVALYDFTYSYETQKEIKKSRMQSNSHKNPHCVGARPVNWRYSVSESNCEIDINSISITTDWVSSKSIVGGAENITDSGFNVTGSAQNRGSCGPKVFGTRAGKDARGGFGVTAKWIESCTQIERIEAPRTAGCVRWNEDVLLDTIEPSVKDWTIKLTLLDGSTKVVSQEEDLGVVSVERPSNTSVLIKPQKNASISWNASFSAQCENTRDKTHMDTSM